MSDWSNYVDSILTGAAHMTRVGGVALVDSFGSVGEEYEALCRGAALLDRGYRCLLEVTGRDRASWLHNLTTNQVKTLGRDEGVYAFALNVQGRILFDLTVIVRRESIWLDIGRLFVETAVRHFNKYIITEDVRVVDRSHEFQRFAISGDHAADPLAEMGMPQARTMALFNCGDLCWNGISLSVCRTDFCGPSGYDLWVSSEKAVEFWQALTGASRDKRVTPVGYKAAASRRIEEGIAWAGSEITDEYLPAETGLFERAVSINKGCYLGQEVVERMRSRSAVARRLVGLEVNGSKAPSCPARISDDDGQSIGTLTSVCHSVGLGRIIGLGYVKTASIESGKMVTVAEGGEVLEARMVELPFVK